MHPEIKTIIPLAYEFETDRYAELNDNVTFIIRICEGNRRKVYSLEDWIDTLGLEINFVYRLRYDEEAGRATISDGRIVTNEPQGIVLNMIEVEAEKFEQLLLFPLLAQEGDVFTVTKINNCEIIRKLEREQNEIFDSLFSVE